MSCPLTCSHLVWEVCRRRCAAANHWTASVYICTVLAALASAASASRNELISGWNVPAASGFRRRPRDPLASIVCLSSRQTAAAQHSAGQRFRWSESSSNGVDTAMTFPLLRRFPQVRGLASAWPCGGQGRGRTADLPLFRFAVLVVFWPGA